MSDPIHHECGLAFVRLKKDLAYYHDRYGTSLWGFQRLYLLMEKQHNRGQDGVGIGCCKLNMPLGEPYLFRQRNAERDSLIRVMEGRLRKFAKLERKGILDPDDPASCKRHFDFGGEVLLGHLRYGTSGSFGSGGCHPYVRRTNYPTKSMMVLGNFNMTNARDLNHHLIDRGQHPVFDTDTQTVLEEIGYHLDEAHDAIYRRERDAGTEGRDIPPIISEEIDLVRILSKCEENWDGGYSIAGVIGNGDGFVFRDPHGIRPCFFYEDDEVIAFASERVPLMTVFNAPQEKVQELAPGHVGYMRHSGGDLQVKPFAAPAKITPCSFERIYFSRGNDPDIYRERMQLGANLVPQIIPRIEKDFDKTVFSFVPNTAEIAYYGLMHGLRKWRRDEVKKEILEAAQSGELNEETIDSLILKSWPRGEKIAHKDIKLRTFIAQEKGRNQMVSHVYDVTYGQVQPGENLVVLDDSIVRGTTLKSSIIKILSRLDPKKIIVVSTAPQIRYPDCYGIDMSEMGKFIVFKAAVNLIEQRGMKNRLTDVYYACLEELKKPVEEMQNPVKAIYEPFTEEELSAEVSKLVTPDDIPWHGEVEVVFQTVEALHSAIPHHQGDWYFTGNYPTPGGYKVVNQAFVGFMDKTGERPYDVLL
ncbi:MAG: amidophosphoribosyltransferase [Verrucomicrobiales bacterium]|nr:amidophosphoribosyltransferase [Verrucomicrobiales bacterium]